MPRKPDGLTARSEHITARFRPSTAAALDRLRGPIPRSRYLEKLVIDADAKKNGTPREHE